MRSRKTRKFYNIGIAPSAVTTGATCGKGFTTMLPYMGWAGAGFAIYLVGLFHFNRILVKYKRAKAVKEVDKQQEAVKALSDRIRQKNPAIKPQIALKMAHKSLEDAYLEKEHEKVQRYKVIDGDVYTRNYKDQWIRTS